MVESPVRDGTWSRILGFLEIVLSRWKIVLLCVFAGACIAIGSIFFITPKWTASAVVGPIVPDPRYGLTQGLNLTSGLSLLGQASGPEGQRFARFKVLLHSRVLAEHLEQKHHVLPLVFYREWDQKRGQWKPYFSFRRVLRQIAGLQTSPVPTIDDLKEYLEDHMDIVLAEPQTPNTVVSFAFKDRDTALNIVKWSISEADQIIRSGMEKNIDTQIAYLDEQLSRNDSLSSANRLALSNALMDAEKYKVLIVGGQPYSADIVSAPSAPVLPDFPNPLIFLLVGSVLGLAAGCLLAWLQVMYGAANDTGWVIKWKKSPSRTRASTSTELA